MSIVNQESLQRIEQGKSDALSAHSYEAGYNRALRALEAAIAQLKQIDTMTRNLEIKVVEKG